MSMEEAFATVLGINPRGHGDDDEGPAPLPEVQIATMREYCDLYQKPCRFRVGDLVTPRPGVNVRGDGDPHVVLEVFKQPIQALTAMDPHMTGASAFGRKMDMRVMCCTNGQYSSFCVESFVFEPYEGAE